MNAPNFQLKDQFGKTHTLSEYKGKWVVLYVYPKDDTPGCTKEACAFRDRVGDFKKLGVTVIGLSKDTDASHKRFADKFRLPFTLLSDPTHETIEKLGAWGKKKFMGREFDGTLRNTYIINPDGEVEKEYKGVNPLTHTDEILKDLALLL